MSTHLGTNLISGSPPATPRMSRVEKPTATILHLVLKLGNQEVGRYLAEKQQLLGRLVYPHHGITRSRPATAEMGV